MRAVATDLEAAGLVITSRWLGSPAPLTASDLEPGGSGEQLAMMDLEDLRRSDICLAFTEDSHQVSRGRGGRHTELGMAIGLGLKVLIVGPREHVFHALPSIERFSDWPSARAALTGALSKSPALATT